MWSAIKFRLSPNHRGRTTQLSLQMAIKVYLPIGTWTLASRITCWNAYHCTTQVCHVCYVCHQWIHSQPTEVLSARRAMWSHWRIHSGARFFLFYVLIFCNVAASDHRPPQWRRRSPLGNPESATGSVALTKLIGIRTITCESRQGNDVMSYSQKWRHIETVFARSIILWIIV